MNRLESAMFKALKPGVQKPQLHSNIRNRQIPIDKRFDHLRFLLLNNSTFADRNTE